MGRRGYCEDEIAADPNLEVTEISEPTGYPRLKGATPLRVPLVPAYRQLHHARPHPRSAARVPVVRIAHADFLPPDHRLARAPGGASDATGFVRLGVQVGVPGAPDDSDVNITAGLSDVRCAGSGPACGPANAAGGSDYTGELEANMQVRLTDKYNGTSAGGARTRRPSSTSPSR